MFDFFLDERVSVVLSHTCSWTATLAVPMAQALPNQARRPEHVVIGGRVLMDRIGQKNDYFY